MTKYSMEVLDRENNEWTPVALFSDIVPVDVLHEICNAMWGCIEGIEQVAVIDMDTGEVVAENDTDAEVWDDCDNDCGYDPYLGCYTDDC